MNAYFICVIVLVQMWYIINCMMIRPKKIFEYFICFWKFFSVSLLRWKFFQKAKFVLLKNSFKGIFASKSREKLSHNLTVKMRKLIFISSKILHREFSDSLIAASREIASRETYLMHSRHFTSIPQVLREKLSREMSGFLVFKWANSDNFSKTFFCLLRASLNPKHIFHSNLNQNLEDFDFNTYLRYVLTSFSLWFLRLRLRFLNF